MRLGTAVPSLTMYDDILLPTDGSAGTSAAMEHALAIGADHAATIHGLYVVDSRLARAAAEDRRDEIVADLEAQGEQALGEVRDPVEDAGLEAVTVQRDGVPHRVVVEYADEHGVDLIVMGTHGRTGPDRLANLGSTTERVVENGDHPVLVVDID
jgi:nucleotide-binding universal stress UspA family protein